MPENSLNFRDVGGLPAAGGCTRSGVLFRSEGPRNFTALHRDSLRERNFRSIVDLRSGRERQEDPHDWHGPDCRWLELDVNADLRVFGNDGRERLQRGPEPEIAIETMMDAYRDITGALLPHWPVIAEALVTGHVPMLLHCTAGKDRTGVAVALLLELAGVPRAAIIEDYMRSAVFAENLMRAGGLETGLLQSFGFMPSPAQVEALIGVREEYLHAAWDELAREWSDLPGYFTAAGVDEELQRRMGQALVE